MTLVLRLLLLVTGSLAALFVAEGAPSFAVASAMVGLLLATGVLVILALMTGR